MKLKLYKSYYTIILGIFPNNKIDFDGNKAILLSESLGTLESLEIHNNWISNLFSEVTLEEVKSSNLVSKEIINKLEELFI